MATKGGRSGKKSDFDDQAWGVESDDDEFVSQIAPRTNVPRSLRSSSRSSSYSSNHLQRTASSSSGTTQPLPTVHTSIPSSSSLSNTPPNGAPTASLGSASTSILASASIPAPASASTSASTSTSTEERPSSPLEVSGRRTSWTVIDRDLNPRQTSSLTSEAPIAGSPPTDLGRSLLGTEEVRSQSRKHQKLQAVRDSLSSGSETDEFDLDTGKSIRRKRSTNRKAKSGKTEAELLKLSMRDDMDDLVTDPASALAALSLSWSSSDPTPHTPTSERSTEPVATTSRFGVAPTPKSKEFTFDPIAAAGDGLIITGPSFAELAEENKLQGTSFSSSSSASHLSPLGSSDPSNNNGTAIGSISRKRSVRSSRRRQQLLSCLSKQSVDIGQLRTLAWAGVPDELRPIVWQLLLGYLPAVASVRSSTLARKRAEYASGVKLAFAKGTAALDQAIWHQIHIDVPRTNPGIRLWQREATQRSLERILYVWAIRHPASGYVQGINDLATPFFEVFLSAYIDSDPELFDVSLLPPHVLEAVEADTFWCLSKLLDGIQDNYIFAQPGIQRQVRRLGELVARIDAPLHAHLEQQGVEYMQFAFRWMNCLLMREMSVRNIIRMWDTYLAEGPDAFSDFHLYVCSVFLHKWTDKLQTMDFQGIIMFLQSLPTQGWSDKDAEMLLSEAFMYKTLFGNTAHLNK